MGSEAGCGVAGSWLHSFELKGDRYVVPHRFWLSVLFTGPVECLFGNPDGSLIEPLKATGLLDFNFMRRAVYPNEDVEQHSPGFTSATADPWVSIF